jgi:flavin-dependent dehydrogenase/CRP-like cAMP-binding protein
MLLVNISNFSRLFSHLSSSLSDTQIARLIGSVVVQNYEAGEEVITEGTETSSLFMVWDGALNVVKSAEKGEIPLATVEAGSLLGEVSLLDPGPATATVRSDQGCTVLELSREALEALWADSPVIASAFLGELMRTMAARLQGSDADEALRVLRDSGVQVAKELRQVTEKAEARLTNLSSANMADDEYDVVVMGGGPIGIQYATFLLDSHPGAKVVVLDAKATPGHKVGESILSSTMRGFEATGLPQPAQRRLFGNKGGLTFFYAGDDGKPSTQLNLTHLDETYQVERRVLEMAMQMAARKKGIEFRLGTRVKLKESELDGRPFKSIACQGPDGEMFKLKARMLVDASGGASALLRELGVYRKDPDRIGTFNYNAYWAYFKRKQVVDIPLWPLPSTRHICFPGGWMWIITLTSWEGNSDEKVSEMLEFMLDHPKDAPDEDFLSRDETAAKFGLESKQTVSFGITVRSDMDTAEDLPMSKRFQHYADKIPAIRWVLDHYELIEDPYDGKKRPYFGAQAMAHDATQVAGDGWLAVGDAAAFVSPFYSPGLMYGVGQAFKAAEATAKALKSGDLSRSAFADYEKYAGDVFHAISKEHDMFYRAFKYEASYERVMALKIQWSLPTVISLKGYNEEDTHVHDIFNPEWQAFVEKSIQTLKASEEPGLSEDEVLAHHKKFQDDASAYLAGVHKSWDEKGINMTPYFDFWQDDGSYGFRENKPRGDYNAVCCQNCGLYPDDTLYKCPYCGVELAERYAGEAAE